MKTEPVNFGKGPRSWYPLNGPRIGPAWRMIWARLRPYEWVTTAELANLPSVAGNIDPKTVYNLLWAARKAGQVTSRRNGRTTEWRGKQ